MTFEIFTNLVDRCISSGVLAFGTFLLEDGSTLHVNNVHGIGIDYGDGIVCFADVGTSSLELERLWKATETCAPTDYTGVFHVA